MLTSTDQQAITEARALDAARGTGELREVYRLMGGTGDYPVQADLFAALLGRAGALAGELAGMVERREEKIAHLIGEVDHLHAELDAERTAARGQIAHLLAGGAR